MAKELKTVLELASETSRVYYHLETLCLCFPGRISGSDILESAIDFLRDLGDKEMKLPVMREELVTDCPNWERGDNDKEKLFVDIAGDGIWPMPNPLHRTLRIMANGHSPGTGESGIRGKIISVMNNEELKKAGDVGQLENAIVLYDFKHYTKYGDLSGPIRGCGANSASKFGAAGVLNRAIAPDGSTSGLHTGTIMPFEEGVKPIPTVCES